MKVKFDRPLSLTEAFELFGFRFEGSFIYFDDCKVFSIYDNTIAIDSDDFERWWPSILNVVTMYEMAFLDAKVVVDVISENNLNYISFLSTDDNVL
jgi:hypothetical protein